MSAGTHERTHADTIDLDEGLAIEARKFRLVVIDGAEVGREHVATGARCSIGSHESNEVAIADPSMSRFHCDIVITGGRARLVDLGSKNGSLIDGVAVERAHLRDGSTITLGRTKLRFELMEGANRTAVSKRTEFGGMVGKSVTIRAAFAVLERAAASDATVLLEGETGTGKGEAAEAIHRESARAEGPFVTVDCGAIPENLIESELFGHEKGAFTGALRKHQGAFEQASGGTLFLDEIGELPLTLQPKLLRVLEQKSVKPVGGTGTIAVDVRIIAATNRDLRAEVNNGAFRSDLFYRLAVLRIGLPALRVRPEDLPALVDRLLAKLGASPEQIERAHTRKFVERLHASAFPGNVRELRNQLERALVMGDLEAEEASPASESREAPQPAERPIDAELGDILALEFSAARDQAIARFERDYLVHLMAAHAGHVATAATAAGIGRVHLYKLLARHRLK